MKEIMILYNSESDKKYTKLMYNVNEFWSKYDITLKERFTKNNI